MSSIVTDGAKNNFINRITIFIRREGITGILSRVKNMLLSGVYLQDGYIFSLKYAETHITHPVERIEVGELVDPSPADCEEIGKYHFHTNTGEDVLKYLAEGQRCFVARYENRIVSWFWIIRNEFYDFHLHRKIILSDEEDYFLGGFTVPEFRGKGILDHLVLEIIQEKLRWSRDACRQAIAFVDVKNQSSQKACRKMGFAVVGHIGYLNIFGIKLNYVTSRNVLPKLWPRLVVSR